MDGNRCQGGWGRALARAHGRASLAEDMEEGHQQGFGARKENLSDGAGRTMMLQQVIKAPRPVVWTAWMNPETLPRW